MRVRRFPWHIPFLIGCGVLIGRWWPAELAWFIIAILIVLLLNALTLDGHK